MLFILCILPFYSKIRSLQLTVELSVTYLQMWVVPSVNGHSIKNFAQ